MSVSFRVQLAIEPAYAVADPGFFAFFVALSAKRDNLIKGGVDSHIENILADCARQSAGNMECIQWQDAAQFRLDPEHARIICGFRHGKNPAGIGFQKNFRRYFQNNFVHTAHTTRCLFVCCEIFLQPVDIIIAVLHILIAHKITEQRQGCVDAINDELVESAA